MMLSGCVPTHVRAALAAALTIAALALCAPAQATPGDLDPTFGSGGIVFSNLDTVKGSAIIDVAVQPDGGVVALEFGFSGSRHLLRYGPDGTLDPSFDGDGIAVIPSDVWANAIALQADGKIVVSGNDASYNFVVARFLSTGQIDQGFDGDTGIANGVVRTKLTPGVDMATSLAVDGQGRIVVAGDAGSAPATSDAGILRLLPDGHLDKWFAGDGTLVYDTAVEVRVHDVAVQSDGKIVIGAGWGSYPTVDTMIQRFRDNGVADTFGPGGLGRRIIDLGPQDRAGHIALQPGGQVLVGSTSSSGDKLIRLTAGGDFDAGFGSGGEVLLKLWLEGIALAPDGKIVLGGSGEVGGLGTFALQRLSADGAPDPAFAGGSPVLRSAVDGQRSAALTVAVGPDGKIVSGGKTGEYPGARAVLMRAKSEPDPVATPDSQPVTTMPAASALTLSGLRLTNRRFVVGRRHGTSFVFRLNRSATVSIRIKRLVSTGSGRRTRAVALLKRTAQAGGNRVRFSGRVGRGTLRPGRYRASLTAVDANGNRTKPQTVRFRVVRG
jgi:uncharacterized delta-60 repeat protein